MNSSIFNSLFCLIQQSQSQFKKFATSLTKPWPQNKGDITMERMEMQTSMDDNLGKTAQKFGIPCLKQNHVILAKGD